ncbi:hypothetical protein E2C01_010579 [Portunus trituberculatus]|uniref:Uncharacterized protein n=1 Tax=Portunus trituberculatus TaxID=210409 RepID=A0A5B7D984_PORTR|nr:hypothetical protein [Portunus trituberculatus]
MQNFGTDATHTAHTDSKIACLFLAIASMGHTPWDSRLCGFVSRGIPFFDRTDLTPKLSLTHCPSPLKIALITPLPPPPPPPCQELSSQLASTTANVSSNIAPSVNIPIATKVIPTLVHHASCASSSSMLPAFSSSHDSTHVEHLLNMSFLFNDIGVSVE